MTNFVRVGDAPYVINLEQAAYVDTAPKTFDGETIPNAIRVFFPTIAGSDYGTGYLSLLLTGDNADRFMTMLDRQTGVW